MMAGGRFKKAMQNGCLPSWQPSSNNSSCEFQFIDLVLLAGFGNDSMEIYHI